MKINVPDLNYVEALEFCKKLCDFQPSSENVNNFDFSNVKNCDPFPMLIVSNAIRNKRNEFKGCMFNAQNCNNDYAQYMKFYRACGINKGEEVEISRGNAQYSCITKLCINDLRNEGINSFDVIQEVIEKKAKSMAKILARGNKSFEMWLAFVIRELIRNIPEHSKSETIWYCAQYWPSYDLVELGIFDEGQGIKDSLKSNWYFKKFIEDDLSAIKLSLEPGITSSYLNSNYSITKGDWENSGYGLFMVSQMCAELDASFILASGDAAYRIYKDNGNICNESFETFIKGTAIQIRIRPSTTVDYEEIRKRILSRGEKMAKTKSNAVHSASKASKGF